MDISVSVKKQGNHILVAACDVNLLGKTLRFGKINITIRRDFYGGMVVDVEEAMSYIRRGTAVNLMGSVIVQKAVDEGMIHPHAILNISGVPHTQIVRL